MTPNQQFYLGMTQIFFTFLLGVIAAVIGYFTIKTKFSQDRTEAATEKNAVTLGVIHNNTNSLVAKLVDQAKEEGRQEEKDRVTTLASKEDMARLEEGIDEVPKEVVKEIDRSKTDSEKG